MNIDLTNALWRLPLFIEFDISISLFRLNRWLLVECHLLFFLLWSLSSPCNLTLEPLLCLLLFDTMNGGFQGWDSAVTSTTEENNDPCKWRQQADLPVQAQGRPAQGRAADRVRRHRQQVLEEGPGVRQEAAANQNLRMFVACPCVFEASSLSSCARARDCAGLWTIDEVWFDLYVFSRITRASDWRPLLVACVYGAIHVTRIMYPCDRELPDGKTLKNLVCWRCVKTDTCRRQFRWEDSRWLQNCWAWREVAERRGNPCIFPGFP